MKSRGNVRYVVTGGSGFIGRRLCRLLASDGVASVSRGRLAAPDFPGVKGFAWTDLPRFSGAVCIHLAGNNRIDEIERYYEGNLKEAKELARRVRDNGFSRIIFASSAAVYGDAARTPRAEDCAARPTSKYGRLKLELESLFSGGSDVVARLSNVYGPGMSPANVFSHILGQLQAGDSVVIRDAASVRDYLFISDAAAALAALARGQGAGVYNVSTGRGTSVRELVALLAGRLGKMRYTMRSELKGVRSSLILDSSRLRRETGWRPRVVLREGAAALIKEMVP